MPSKIFGGKTLIMRFLSRGVLTAAVLSGAALGVAAPAQAAETDLTISATRLVLEPGQRGYTGTYHVTVTNTGDEPAVADLRVIETTPGAWRGLRPDDSYCFTDTWGTTPVGYLCELPGGEVAPGEIRKFRIDMGVLTTPRDHALRGADTLTTLVSSSDSTRVVASASSPTLFRSTTGSLRDPQPYVQDEQSDISVTAGDVTLTPDPEGGFTGKVPVTIRWNGDAPHHGINTETVVPEGFEARGADADDITCMFPYCYVADEPLMPGETITVNLEVYAPEGTPSGTTATGAIVATGSWWGGALSNVDPDANRAPFRMTIA